MIGCFILLVRTSILIQLTWFRACSKAKKVYYNLYYFHSFMYLFWFVTSRSPPNPPTLGRFFEPLYYTFKSDQNWKRYNQNKCTMLRAPTYGLCAEICSLCSAVRPWVAPRWLVRFKRATTHPNLIRIEEDIVKTSVQCSALRLMVCVRRYVHYAPRSDHGSHCGG